MTYQERVEINPLICSGKPVIKGTRIMVSSLISQLAAGETAEGLKKGYPGLTDADIRAALDFAAATLDNVEVQELK